MSDDPQPFSRNLGDRPPFTNRGSTANPAIAAPNFDFSPEELRALKECNKESFYQRCLPLSTVFALGAYHGVQKGFLKPNPKYGPTPKVMLGVVLGYIFGKLSYRNKCAEKLMAIPDSQIGSMLRERRNPLMGLGRQSAPMFGANPGDVYSDAGQGSSLDLDTDRPTYKGLPDFDPNTEVKDTSEIHRGVSPVMTYDELRKKNREGTTVVQEQPYKIDPPPSSPVRARSESKRKNKYGDVVDE